MIKVEWKYEEDSAWSVKEFEVLEDAFTFVMCDIREELTSIKSMGIKGSWYDFKIEANGKRTTGFIKSFGECRLSINELGFDYDAETDDNLWTETRNKLRDNDYGVKDIAAVFGNDFQIPIDNFIEVAKRTKYNGGYGAQEVAEDLVILMKDGSWFERNEYDGSEWWEHRKTPVPPADCKEIGVLADNDYYNDGHTLRSLNSKREEWE
jgi:hypothetical protein